MQNLVRQYLNLLLLHASKGQGLVEYALIIVLISIVAIVDHDDAGHQHHQRLLGRERRAGSAGRAVRPSCQLGAQRRALSRAAGSPRRSTQASRGGPPRRFCGYQVVKAGGSVGSQTARSALIWRVRQSGRLSWGRSVVLLLESSNARASRSWTHPCVNCAIARSGVGDDAAPIQPVATSGHAACAAGAGPESGYELAGHADLDRRDRDHVCPGDEYHQPVLAGDDSLAPLIGGPVRARC